MSWATAALSAGHIAWSWPSPVGFLFALGLPLLVLRLPVTGIVLVAVVAQEVNPRFRGEGLDTFAHHAFLGPSKIPVILPLAMTAVLAAMARRWPPREVRVRPGDAALFGSAGVLVLLTIGIGLLAGQSVLSAVNQNGRPFILMVLGLALGVSLRWLPGERRLLVLTVGVALVGLLIAAAVVIPLGGSADPRLSRYFVYYDWALPAIATAVFSSLLGVPGGRWEWWRLTVVAATPLLIMVSFRRSVWIATVLILLIVFALNWTRWSRMVQRLAFASLVMVVIVVAAPGLATDLRHRVTGGSDLTYPPAVANHAAVIPTAGPGSAGAATPKPPSPPAVNHQAASDTGHIEDLRRGWGYVRANFWTGVGPRSPQLDGMAARNTARVYVHNELLQLWLRYGPVAPLLVSVFFATAGLLALRALRDPDSDVITRSAAAFSLVAPLCFMTGAFLSDTSRWPLLVGIAAGLLLATGRRRGAPRQRSATAP